MSSKPKQRGIPTIVMNQLSSKACLVTGGAGFIGCALSSHLAALFDRVVAVDNLHPQIHARQVRPTALDEACELMVQDVTESATWDSVLSNFKPDFIVHLAAETGTGQSLRESTRHAMVNVVGTTQMLDGLARHNHYPEAIVLTSSRAIYGEGAWQRSDGSCFYPGQRNRSQLESATWDFPDARPMPFAASQTQPSPTSIYGATKFTQELVLRAWCLAFGVAPRVLRLQNAFGPGQSLTNPYTGIVSLFVRMAKSGQSIPLYEDGKMARDFVLIDDVTSAIIAALGSGGRDLVLDIGTGRATSIQEVAEIIARRYGAPAPHICGKYRDGDVRHAVCDISPTIASLDWAPAFDLETGLDRLCKWIDDEEIVAPVAPESQ